MKRLSALTLAFLMAFSLLPGHPGPCRRWSGNGWKKWNPPTGQRPWWHFRWLCDYSDKGLCRKSGASMDYFRIIG